MKPQCNLTRRRALQVLGVGTGGLLTACSSMPEAQTSLPSAYGYTGRELLYIGSHADQILAGWFHARSGALLNIAPVAPALRPNWAIQDGVDPILYLALGDPEGTVQSFSIDYGTGALRQISSLATGAGVSHISFDASSRTLLAANYGAGHVAALAVSREGALERVTSTVVFAGSGPHPRQASPHPHGVVIDKSGTRVVVPDLGADRVFVLDLSGSERQISWRGESAAYSAPPGSGPRHAVFGRDGRHLYVLNELTAVVDVLRWDAAFGTLHQVSSYDTNSAGFSGRTSAAEIDISPDGRFIYTSNRGESTLVAFAIDETTGLLEPVQRVDAGGEFPWTFVIHRDGNWMLVANANSNSIAVFAIDRVTGLLTLHGRVSDVPNPHSLTLVAIPERRENR